MYQLARSQIWENKHVFPSSILECGQQTSLITPLGLLTCFIDKRYTMKQCCSLTYFYMLSILVDKYLYHQSKVHVYIPFNTMNDVGLDIKIYSR